MDYGQDKYWMNKILGKDLRYIFFRRRSTYNLEHISQACQSSELSPKVEKKEAQHGRQKQTHSPFTLNTRNLGTKVRWVKTPSKQFVTANLLIESSRLCPFNQWVTSYFGQEILHQTFRKSELH